LVAGGALELEAPPEAAAWVSGAAVGAEYAVVHRRVIVQDSPQPARKMQPLSLLMVQGSASVGAVQPPHLVNRWTDWAAVQPPHLVNGWTDWAAGAVPRRASACPCWLSRPRRLASTSACAGGRRRRRSAPRTQRKWASHFLPCRPLTPSTCSPALQPTMRIRCACTWGCVCESRQRDTCRFGQLPEGGLDFVGCCRNAPDFLHTAELNRQAIRCMKRLHARRVGGCAVLTSLREQRVNHPWL
jgi:hypothetical protein